MINGECLIAYSKQYPNDDCGYEMNTNKRVSIGNKNGQMVMEPHEHETDAIFMDRLKRSKECGRNLFFEEWEPFEYKPGCLY